MIKPSVSVVIPFYNRTKLLKCLLDSLFSVAYSFSEVVMVNDCSIENASFLLNAYNNRIILLNNERRLGPAYSKNIGALNAGGDYLLFLDSDVEIVNKYFISEMCSFCQRFDFIAAIGGEFIKADKGLLIKGYKISLDGKTLSSSFVADDGLMQRDYIPTSNLFISKELFYKIGGFDPYYIYPGEDKDLLPLNFPGI